MCTRGQLGYYHVESEMKDSNELKLAKKGFVDLRNAVLTYTRQTFLTLNSSQYEGLQLKGVGDVKKVTKFLAKVGLGSTESDDTQWGFVVRSKGKALTVFADSQDDLKKWMNAIGRCIVHIPNNEAFPRPKKTGWLIKFFPGDMEKKIRFVELFEGALKYYEDSVDDTSKVQLSLEDCRFGAVPDVKDTFFIASKEMNTVWHFTAESDFEMHDWLRDIKENAVIKDVRIHT